MQMTAFTPASLPDLSSKVYLVTGGNAGIGYETILHLVRKNATVWMGARSKAKGDAAITSIREQLPGADVHLLILDHMNLSSVVAAAKEFNSKSSVLHGLVNNAGIMAVPFEVTKDGYESQWQTNYIAHWLLTHHLLPTILATAKISALGDVRIVNLTSNGHNYAPRGGIDFEDINQVKGGGWTRYGQSKLGNILHAKYINSLYGPNGTKKSAGEIWSMAVHPGAIYTDLSKNAQFLGRGSKMVGSVLNRLGVFIPADQGAYTTVFCAASQDVRAAMTGEYFTPIAKIGKPSKFAKDERVMSRLWEWTESELKVKGLL
jgi:NAD(P)-dependent dehydrogenase (short-subunit alcohol dehydrogenase family)